MASAVVCTSRHNLDAYPYARADTLHEGVPQFENSTNVYTNTETNTKTNTNTNTATNTMSYTDYTSYTYLNDKY